MSISRKLGQADQKSLRMPQTGTAFHRTKWNVTTGTVTTRRASCSPSVFRLHHRAIWLCSRQETRLTATLFLYAEDFQILNQQIRSGNLPGAACLSYDGFHPFDRFSDLLLR